MQLGVDRSNYSTWCKKGGLAGDGTRERRADDIEILNRGDLVTRSGELLAHRCSTPVKQRGLLQRSNGALEGQS